MGKYKIGSIFTAHTKINSNVAELKSNEAIQTLEI